MRDQANPYEPCEAPDDAADLTGWRMDKSRKLPFWVIVAK
jgi:hypothetical protein